VNPIGTDCLSREYDRRASQNKSGEEGRRRLGGSWKRRPSGKTGPPRDRR